MKQLWLILILLMSFVLPAISAVIFEDDFTADSGWVGNSTTGTYRERNNPSTCGSDCPPSKWDAYKIGNSNESLSVVASAGKNGVKPALKFGYDPGNGQRLALSLAKHLTGNKNTGYTELYIRYEMKFDDGWLSGDGTNTDYWKWFRLWQYRPVWGINSADEADPPCDTRYIIGHLNLAVPAYSLAANTNRDICGVSTPYYTIRYSGTTTCATCGKFESINNWKIQDGTGAFINNPQDWHQVEFHIKLNTGGDCDGTENGIFEVYLDGVLQTTSLSYSAKYGETKICSKLMTQPYPDANGGVNYFVLFDNMADWASSWGANRYYMYLDNVVISTTPIGIAYTVGGGSNPLIISTTSLSVGDLGQAYSQTVTASSGTTPYAWSISGGTLPTGLSINSSTGAITGTPSASGVFNFTVQVTDSANPVNIDTQNLSITINPQNLVFYSTTGDGQVYMTDTSWASTRASANATSADSAYITTMPRSRETGGNFTINRAFIPFDTATIPDNITITSADIQLCGSNNKTNTDDDGNDYLAITSTSQATHASLSVTDFDNVSDTIGSNTIDLGNMTATGCYTFNLDVTGISWINKTGITWVGVREGHDIENDTITTGANNSWSFYTSNNTINKPRLTVYYSNSAPPPPPVANTMSPAMGTLNGGIK